MGFWDDILDFVVLWGLTRPDDDEEDEEEEEDKK